MPRGNIRGFLHLVRWPRRGQRIAVLLSCAFFLILIGELTGFVRLFPHSGISTVDQVLSAIAAGTGLLALVLATLATWLSVIAWFNSNEKPDLLAEINYVGMLEREDNWNPALAIGPPARQPDWSLDILIRNAGPVAARFPAILVTFEGCRISSPSPFRRGSGWRLLPARGPWSEAEWSGGADVVIHPGLPYLLDPLVGTLVVLHDHPIIKIVVVADDFKSKPKDLSFRPCAVLNYAGLLIEERFPG